jgi:hypothetical protein
MVKQWMDYFNNSEEAWLPWAGIVAYPAGDPDTSSYIRIELEGCPLANNGMDGEVWEITEYTRACAQVKPPRLVPTKALAGLLLALDESGEAGKDLRTWDLDIWTREALDLW